MSRHAALKSFLRTSRNKIPFLSPHSTSTPLTSGFLSSVQSHSPSQHPSSKLHSVADVATLKAALNITSEPKIHSSWRSPIHGPPCNATFTTTELNDGSEDGSESQTLTVQDSESSDDSDATSSRSTTPENVFWTSTPNIHSGQATSEGTERFAAKFSSVGKNYFRAFQGTDDSDSLFLSSVGIGAFLGSSEFRSGKLFQSLIESCITRGVNVIDTSSNHLDQYSERVIGHALNHLIESQQLKRDEIFVCTKGGFIPREHWKTKDHSEEYLHDHFISKGIFDRDDVAGHHCLAPSFLHFMLDSSRANLGLECIDLYYLQNIETHMNYLNDEEKFYGRIKDAFELLEGACEEKRIRHYGVSCRNENLIEKESSNFISLERLMNIAKSVGGEKHHFKVLQTPYNADSLQILNNLSQSVDGKECSVVDAAKELGLYNISASSNYFIGVYRGLPAKLGLDTTGMEGLSAAATALHYTRTLPNLLSALFSFRNPRNIEKLFKVVECDS